MTTHEGKRLREVLRRAGLDVRKLTEACRVTRPAVDRYLNAAVIREQAWRTCRQGLVRLGLDPTEIKPDDPEVTLEAQDLCKMVQGCDRAQLEMMRKILTSSSGDRERLLFYIDGRLAAK